MAERNKPAPPRSSSTTLYAALLRGINVGGNNMLPMPELAGMFAAAGCEQVRTYIQSGNVVFAATRKVAEVVPDVLPPLIGKKFGFEPPIVVRSADELARIEAGCPFPVPNAGPHSLHVLFLAAKPDARRIAALDPDRSPGDSFAVIGNQVYLNLTNGAGKTKLTNAYFDSRLGTMGTGRNWRTVLTLVEMTRTVT